MNQAIQDSVTRQAGSAALRNVPRLAGLMLLTVGLGHLWGCGAGKPPPPEVVSHSEGDFNAPLVISGNPQRDAAAYDTSDDELTEADWKVLEKLGPRPIWEQLAHRHRQSQRMNRKMSRSTVAVAHPSTTQPTTQPVVDEANLPVEIIPQPDGKLRIIWTLRSFGGPIVTSTRDATTARRNVTAAPADLTPLVNVLAATVGAGGVLPLARENTLVITCEPKLKNTVLDLLDHLDVPVKQVEITAKIFEVSHDFDFQQGTEMVLSRLASDSGQSLTSTFSAKRFVDALENPTGAPVQGSVLHLMQVFESAGVQLDVSFQFLQDAGLINVVSAPRMTVAAGQTGYMLAGQEVPIQSSSIVNNVIQVGTQYKPVGVQLYITPEAVGTHRVKLHAISIVSAISGFTPLRTMEGGTQPIVNPVIDSREAETAVTVDDGSTLVISGMQMVRTITRESKIPGLGDLPGLGWLFKNHRTQQEHTDLYFFITPEML
ncbi:MAG TPA: type II and III secretion system protein [Tepidisphaeraceae bacterium]|nr:type II and III secretion system protein [Tepidisphaeraceae bacterium]